MVAKVFCTHGGSQEHLGTVGLVTAGAVVLRAISGPGAVLSRWLAASLCAGAPRSVPVPEAPFPFRVTMQAERWNRGSPRARLSTPRDSGSARLQGRAPAWLLRTEACGDPGLRKAGLLPEGQAEAMCAGRAGPWEPLRDVGPWRRPVG